MQNSSNEIQATDLSQGSRFDATKASYWKNTAFKADWIVTNPPFKEAITILDYSYSHANKGVAMLLRITFLEPTVNRSAFLKNHSDNLVRLIPVNPRPKFRADTKSTDSTTVAWFVWNKHFSWQKLGVKSPFQFEINWNK